MATKKSTKKTREPKIIRPDSIDPHVRQPEPRGPRDQGHHYGHGHVHAHQDDVDPHYQWDRPLQAPGHTQVDFEERINFRRLHDYRLARTRAALANSGLGALLC